MTEQGKKVWKELENMGWSNKPKDFHLEYFEDIIEATKKALTLTDVVVPFYCGEQEEGRQICDSQCMGCDGLERKGR
jgi:hypothetical protein